MKQHKNEDPSRIELTEDELQTLISEIQGSSLSERSKNLVVSVLTSFLWMSRQLESKKLSIKKLLKLFFGSKTEKNKNPNNSKNPKPKDQNDSEDKANDQENESTDGRSKNSTADTDADKPAVKGHGKNGVDKFENAERVSISNPDLKAGSICPSCEDSNLYSYPPAAVLRIFGQPLLVAKVYELERFRCSGCQELFTAPMPVEAGDERSHPSAKAMVAVLNYGSGMPFYRLEGLQQNMGMPVPDATQFDMVEDVANCGAPIIDFWKSESSNASQIANDDTAMKILALIKENKELNVDDRTGMQTTATIAVIDNNKVALFDTGRKHAGENIGELLKQRDPTLPKVLQVGDAAAKNYSHGFMDLVIKVLCMDHGRRNFHEILDNFAPECQHVIDQLGQIYKNDALSKKLNHTPSERLIYHQKNSSHIMNDLNTWMEEKIENHEVEPNGSLGQAIEYFLTHWNGLTAFLRIEGAPLSNAEVERLVKRCVLRRKGSLFYFSLFGALIGDINMSLIETAKFHGKNPHHYLTAIQQNKKHVRANPILWQPWTYLDTLANLTLGSV